MYVIILFPFDGGIPGMDFAPENPDKPDKPDKPVSVSENLFFCASSSSSSSSPFSLSCSSSN